MKKKILVLLLTIAVISACSFTKTCVGGDIVSSEVNSTKDKDLESNKSGLISKKFFSLERHVAFHLSKYHGPSCEIDPLSNERKPQMKDLLSDNIVHSVQLRTVFIRKDKDSLPILREKGAHLRVSSYNIRIAAPDDIKSGNGWETRKIHIAEIIHSHGIDIIGKQEGFPYQLIDLMSLLPGYGYVSYPYGGDGGRSGTASIIYKESEFKVLDKGVFWYSQTPTVESIGWDATDSRICTWAKIEQLSSGIEFYFFTSHFAWRPDKNHGKIAAENSGKLLVDEMKKIDKNNLPIICTGDFNSEPSTPQIIDILGFLKDSRSVTKTPPTGPYNTAFKGGVFEGLPTSRIDYIFVSKNIRVLSHSVLTDSYNHGHYPADHLPVVCDLFMKKSRFL